MSKISGKVKEIFEGDVTRGRSAGKKFWAVTLDDDTRLTCFDGKFLDGVEADKEYVFTIEPRGDFINIVGKTEPQAPSPFVVPQPKVAPQPKAGDFVPVSSLPPPITEQPVIGVTTRVGDERVYKNRISALGDAVTFIAGALGGTASEREVIDTAIRFEEYINTGK